VRVYQPEGAYHWEIEVAHRPTGERFALDNKWAWAKRLRRDAGYMIPDGSGTEELA